MTLLPDGVYCLFLCIGYVPAEPITPPIDTFCTVYRQQVLTQEELNATLNLPRKLRDRMQTNDLYYLCKCQGWSADECQKIPPK